MSRRVKEFIDVEDNASLDDVIQKLTGIRDSLPEDADAELRLRGDDVFGHRITITYFREQTAEEAELEKRYAEETSDGRKSNCSSCRPSSAWFATQRVASAGNSVSSPSSGDVEVHR